MNSRSLLSPDLARERVIGAAEAAAFCGFSLPHFRTLYRTGKVPAPIKISERKLGWRVSSLVDFVNAASKMEA